MADETQLLWIVFLGIGAAVLGVVILLLGLLLESVMVLGREVAAVWSSAVGVFVHTVTAGPQLDRAARRLQELQR